MIEGLLGLLIIIIGVYLAHFIPNYVVYKKGNFKKCKEY